MNNEDQLKQLVISQNYQFFEEVKSLRNSHGLMGNDCKGEHQYLA